MTFVLGYRRIHITITAAPKEHAAGWLMRCPQCGVGYLGVVNAISERRHSVYGNGQHDQITVLLRCRPDLVPVGKEAEMYDGLCCDEFVAVIEDRDLTATYCLLASGGTLYGAARLREAG